MNKDIANIILLYTGYPKKLVDFIKLNDLDKSALWQHEDFYCIRAENPDIEINWDYLSLVRYLNKILIKFVGIGYR